MDGVRHLLGQVGGGGVIDPRELLEYLDSLEIVPPAEQVKVLRVWAEGKQEKLAERQRTFRQIEQEARDAVSH